MSPNELETINDSQFNELKELLEDDFVELIQNFVVDSRERLKTLQEAYTNNDNLTAYDAVHALKGACANLGATALADVCFKLQIECRERRVNSSQALIKNVEMELENVAAEINKRLAS